ncbi:uncharacterized protein APUU_20855A [Aspergillus puulaauensis]|uniref:Fungal N-terminal domain-containing protein n=1 Tax=Aspergillus puulaauensis TaxID=1220207 RepID=A0A7R8AKE2_9EURO|nr:uncharacterized protein APUU_20855A [Aspergillus puulaauensis]BCS20423.1 hypothetical protein APUU_20855A [Aspergillus puulaauensis]
MESEVTNEPQIDYNEVLVHISTNLTNALNTYGSSSAQYQTVLEILKDCLRQIDRARNQVAQNLDPDTLSVALGFLEIGK